ncbi:hypothetical protein H9P43_004270 [Blastocladiella emersonii ATCC 22665]|nr:hypothetical protein H9P43_004270 [Blastocladiella emersonii ATCC 22665]
MDGLQVLVERFYSTGSIDAKNQLESELASLKRRPDAVALVLEQVVEPFLCQSPPAGHAHPQFLFLCLGVVQDSVRQWDTLAPPTQSLVGAALVRAFQTRDAARPRYLSGKIVQLLSEIALFAWPAQCDPFQLAVEQIAAAAGDPAVTRQALDLVLATCQALSGAPTCRFVMAARAAEIKAQWAAFARELEPFVYSVLVPAAGCGDAAAAAADPASGSYPSPLSPNGAASPGRRSAAPDVRATRRCLAILQLLPHQLDTATLGVVRHLCGPHSPLRLVALDTLHAQLSLQRVDQAVFPTLLDVALGVLRDVVAETPNHPPPPAGGDDDVDVDDADDAGRSGGGGSGDDDDDSGTVPPHSVVSRRALRDLAGPVAAMHLARARPHHLLSLAESVVPAVGTGNREATWVVQEVLDYIAPLPNRLEYAPLVSLVLSHAMTALNSVEMGDLDVEEGDPEAAADGGGAMDPLQPATPVTPVTPAGGLTSSIRTGPSRLTGLLGLLTTASEIDPMSVLGALFPALNACVAHVEEACAKNHGAGVPGALVLGLSLSLRAVARMAAALDGHPEIQWMLLSKFEDLLARIAPGVAQTVPGTPRITLELILAVQAYLHVLAARERQGAAEAPPVCARLTGTLLALLASPPSDLAAAGPLAEQLLLAASRTVASVATTVRPRREPGNDWWVSSLRHCMLAAHAALPAGHPATQRLIQAVVATTVFPAQGQPPPALRTPDADARTAELNGHLLAVAAACRDLRDMLPLLRAVLGTARGDTIPVKAIVAAAVPGDWLAHYLGTLERATDPGHLLDLLGLFALLVESQKQSPLAAELVPRILHHPLLGHAAVTAGFHHLLRLLVEDGNTFAPHLVEFGQLASNMGGGNVPPPTPLLRVVSATLDVHWGVFLPGGVRAMAANQPLRHPETFLALVSVLLRSLQSNDIEHVRVGISSLLFVQEKRRLFTRDAWTSNLHSDALQLALAAMVRPGLALLQDDLAGLVKAMLAHRMAPADRLESDLRGIYAFFIAQAPGTSAVAAMWEGRVNRAVQSLRDDHAFELTLKGLLHDVGCMSVYYC